MTTRPRCHEHLSPTPETALGYTEGRVRAFLRDYQRFAQHARPPANEERLGSRPPPADEASWSATARMRADIEQALQLVPWWMVQVAFMHLALGQSSWSKGSNLSWREKVGDWWGMTPGEVNRITDQVIELVVRELNC